MVGKWALLIGRLCLVPPLLPCCRLYSWGYDVVAVQSAQTCTALWKLSIEKGARVVSRA